MDVIPNLSVDGFITDKHMMMVKLYEYFLSADYSQSNTFLGDISSLKFLINETKGAEALKDDVNRTLNKLYERYFETVTVDTVVTDNANSIELKVNVIAIDYDGVTYKLNENISITDNKITNFGLEEGKYHV